MLRTRSREQRSSRAGPEGEHHQSSDDRLPEKAFVDDGQFIANGLLVHNCMGNYHPHGDAAIYGTLVRMAQDFSLRYPLIDPQGKIVKVWTKVDPNHHSEEVLTVIADLKK